MRDDVGVGMSVGEAGATEHIGGQSERGTGAHAAATTVASGFRTDVAPWIGLVLIATAVLALRPPAWVSAPVALLAAVAVVERLARHRRMGPLDGLVVGLGGSIVVVGLLGVALGVSPVGLTFAGWLVGLALLSVGALSLCAGRARPPHLLTGTDLRVTAGSVAVSVITAAILAAALTISVMTTAASQVPPLQMTAAVSGDRATIAITSGTDAGPFDLVTVLDGQNTVVAGGLRVGPDDDVEVTITPPAGQLTEVQLLNPGESVPMREVIVQTGTTSGGS